MQLVLLYLYIFGCMCKESYLYRNALGRQGKAIRTLNLRNKDWMSYHWVADAEHVNGALYLITLNAKPSRLFQNGNK